MTTTPSARIGVVATCLLVGFCIVLTHLWFVMVVDHGEWTRRSQENRWSFRSVPSQRGALLDRTGRVLAYDEPAMQLSVYYLRFRLRHPVGAAVHGATVYARLQPGAEGTTYGYSEGVLGPRAAARDFLAMPVRLLRPGALAKEVASDLSYLATTVLSAGSGLPRKRVFAALRQAAQNGSTLAIGDVLSVPRADLLAAFERSLASLHSFDDEVTASRRARSERVVAVDDEPPNLFDTLELLRRASLRGEYVQWTDPDGKLQTGKTLVETVPRNFADHVPFELAAQLRIGAELHPGLEVAPSIRRMHTEPGGTALQALLGSVALIDRSLPSQAWFDKRIEEDLPDDWLDDFVPPGAVTSEADRMQLQRNVKQRYEREMMQRERRGTNGLEAAFDQALMGRLGLRFVEHDSQRREHLLWSSLQVESGDDVTVTLDLALQQVAQDIVQNTQQQMAAMHEQERDKDLVEAALAVIDARTGDVLAYAGAPIVSRNAADVPGVVWLGNGSIGSVVKPFVLVEQLQSEAVGRPHRPIASFDACTSRFVYQNRVMKCSHLHGEDGRDPVRALAESCNSFFCQSGEGLGEDGLARALRRFGLLSPANDEDALAARWQGSVRGLAIAAPSMGKAEALPFRAIGYAIAASPLSVARAYAGLATGRLPTLGLRLGEVRPQVDLGDIGSELDVVRQGLVACVQNGTAKKIDVLKECSVLGKTGTAEVGKQDQNNAWFAGFVPWQSYDGVQLCFCAVVYWVKDKVHGGDAAGQMVADLLTRLRGDTTLYARYLQPESGR